MDSAEAPVQSEVKALEDEDEEPDSPSSSQVPLSPGGTKPTKYLGVYANRSTFQVSFWDSVLKKHDNCGNFPTAEAAAYAYDQVAMKKFGVGAKLNFPELRNAEQGDNKSVKGKSEVLEESRPGGHTDEKMGRRVSRRKMYRASRIGTPPFKGALEEVARLSLEKDKSAENQEIRDDCEDVEALSGRCCGGADESKENPKYKLQHLSSQIPLKGSLGEVASLRLLGKQNDHDVHQPGPSMPLLDVLAGEFLKASKVLEIADESEAHTEEGISVTSCKSLEPSGMDGGGSSSIICHVDDTTGNSVCERGVPESILGLEVVPVSPSKVENMESICNQDQEIS